MNGPTQQSISQLGNTNDSCDPDLIPSGEAVDAKLKKKKFKQQETYCVRFVQLVLDRMHVTAEYVENELIKKDVYGEHWEFKHCKICQYVTGNMIQILFQFVKFYRFSTEIKISMI